MRKAKERVIYDEYENLFSDSSRTDAIEYLYDCDGLTEDEISEEDISRVLYDFDYWNWDDEKENLKEYFNHFGNYGFICSDDGYNEFIFNDWEELANSIIFNIASYGYDLKIWDENGHFYISAGLNDCWEIKELTKAGQRLYESWNYYGYGEDKSEKDIFKMIMNCNLYSRLPHFAHNVYGCNKYEYEKKGEKTA